MVRNTLLIKFKKETLESKGFEISRAKTQHNKPREVMKNTSDGLNVTTLISWDQSFIGWQIGEDVYRTWNTQNIKVP